MRRYVAGHRVAETSRRRFWGFSSLRFFAMTLTSRALLALLVLPLACDDGNSSGETDDGSSTGSTTTASTTMTSTTASTTMTTMDMSSSSSTDPSTGSSTTMVDPDTGSDSSSGGSTSTGEQIEEVTLQFAARVGDADANCSDTFSGLGTDDSDGLFRDIRFYVSNVRLINDADEEVSVELTQDGTWQVDDVALLDFEDGTNACMGSGDAGLNDVVVGEVPAGTYTGIRFDLGVPNELNHTDPNKADPPLNVLSMTWPWLVGRKFVRIDLNVPTGGVDKMGNPQFNAWNTHLGSQGCSNADNPMDNDPMMPPTMDCTRPQRPQIALDGFDPAANTIVLDIAALLQDNDVTINMAGAPGCQSFMNPMQTDSDCEALFPNYGMDWATGDCADDCSGQTIFSVE